MAKAGTSAWDLTALFNAADPKAGIAERLPFSTDFILSFSYP